MIAALLAFAALAASAPTPHDWTRFGYDAARSSSSPFYTASPDGRIHKLSVADGTALWSTAITRLPQREKLAAALNFSRGLVIAATGGYVGDAPPYQGHVVTLNPSTGAIAHVWNS